MAAVKFQSKHKLDFEVAPYENNIDPENNWLRFRIGTCHGLWASTNHTYDILAIDNTDPGNGHLDDVFEWFENSCKRDKRHLRVLEIMNQPFKMHLIFKRKFKVIGNSDNVIKNFNNKNIATDL